MYLVELLSYQVGVPVGLYASLQDASDAVKQLTWEDFDRYVQVLAHPYGDGTTMSLMAIITKFADGKPAHRSEIHLCGGMFRSEWRKKGGALVAAKQ